VILKADFRGSIEAIRKELADLRETSTRYDVSFVAGAQHKHRQTRLLGTHTTDQVNAADAVHCHLQQYQIDMTDAQFERVCEQVEEILG